MLPAIFVVQAFSQPTVSNAVRDYRQNNEHQILCEFIELLKIPNVASDTENINRNANYLVSELGKHGLNPKLLSAADKNVSPVVLELVEYQELTTPAAFLPRVATLIRISSSLLLTTELNCLAVLQLEVLQKLCLRLPKRNFSAKLIIGA